jgi:hypothetical protein
MRVETFTEVRDATSGQPQAAPMDWACPAPAPTVARPTARLNFFRVFIVQDLGLGIVVPLAVFERDKADRNTAKRGL